MPLLLEEKKKSAFCSFGFLLSSTERCISVDVTEGFLLLSPAVAHSPLPSPALSPQLWDILSMITGQQLAGRAPCLSVQRGQFAPAVSLGLLLTQRKWVKCLEFVSS